MYHRLVEPAVRAALADTPAVLIVGPRRCGKTTLVRAVGTERYSYLTLDDKTTLAAATDDPVAFIRGLDYVILDEIQRAPELLLTIKQSIDEDYQPGRFLMTGSANVLSLPRVADSLAGRMQIISMLPLAQSEIAGRNTNFIDQLFAGEVAAPSALCLGDEFARRVFAGGFPEALSRSDERRRREWFRSYLRSILSRDLRDIADIERLTEIPEFVRYLANFSARLINYSDLGASISVSHKTSMRYVALLEQMYLLSVVQPWHRKALKRFVKTPKVHFYDSGLLSTIRGLSFENLSARRAEYGSILETFVFCELSKLRALSELDVNIYHFRQDEKHEVDFVLESSDLRVVGIEVKANASVSAADFAGLRVLAEVAGDDFACGIILYDGKQTIPFGPQLYAVPISVL